MTFRPEYITRHSDLVTPKQLATRIGIVGAGAIGSFTALALAKMGFSDITVYDFDVIDPENIGNQFYPIECIGQKKVNALAGMCRAFSGIEIKVIDKRIEKTDILRFDVLVVAVDSMAARKMLFETAESRFTIDPRMSAEYCTMHVVDNRYADQRENYSKSLFSDKDAVQERCTAKTTIYTVMLSAGQIVKAIKDVTSGKDHIKTFDWNIADNALIAFNSKGRL